MYAYCFNNRATLFCNVIGIRDKKLLTAFGNHLKELRETKGLSQEVLANKADVSLSQISRMERGVINPTLCSLVAIANALNISLEKLIGFRNLVLIAIFAYDS